MTKSDKSDEPARAQVHYRGQVQGVGFRYTTAAIARQFDVTGTVRNLPDGRVELLAEGRREDVDAFLQRIAERMKGYITDADVQWSAADAKGAFRDFQITF